MELDDAEVVTTPARSTKKSPLRSRYEEIFVATGEEGVTVVLREYETKRDESWYTDSIVNLPPLQALELGINLVTAAHTLLEEKENS